MLGVQRASLYSYVSRGLLPTHALPGQRGHRYALADVQRLARQRQAVRNPARLAQSTLDWGTPVLTSNITQVEDGVLRYRGHDVVVLAGHASLEECAALLWQQKQPIALDDSAPKATKNRASTPPRTPAQALATWFATAPVQAGSDTQPRWHYALLQHMAAVLTGQAVPPAEEALQALQDYPAPLPLHVRLGQLWQQDAAGCDALRQALVLCADHELNASSFAARVVASTGASLHASVGAGLAALSGPLHGGMTIVIDQHWDDWHATHHRPLAPSLAALLADTRQGKTPHYCAGFGHPLYPMGDPRSRQLLSLLAPNAARTHLLHQVHAATGLHPSLDYALVAMQRSLGLPHGAAFVLFALGRTAGWIAHALEQRESGQLIRPRARYTGLTAGSTPKPTANNRRMVRF